MQLRQSATCTQCSHPSQTDFILRSKISLADRQISLRVLLCTRQGRAIGEGCCGGKQRIAAKRTATYGNRLDSVGAVSVTTAHLQLRVAEVNLRYACKRLQKGSQLYYGWRGVANKGTSSASLRLGSVPTTRLNRRSGARHQPLPYWQFLGKTPASISALRRPFISGCTPRAFGALFTLQNFTKSLCNGTHSPFNVTPTVS